MGLSNYELVLLDNLIYLDEITMATEKSDNVGQIVHRLLYADGSTIPGTGTIQTDCIDKRDGKDKCMMDIEEWKQVLLAIEADPTLCSLKIHDVVDAGDNGFRAATFISDATAENVIIFRGTSSPNEWIDNGQGGYSLQTENQKKALDYVNNIDIVNNNRFIVSGHSKGGNLAQYATLFATDTIIDKCLSFDGQGFSQELIETEDYQEAIEKNGENLYMVSSTGDFVNVLFNAAVPDLHKMYVQANDVGGNIMEYKAA